jgi:hypothetical protein
VDASALACPTLVTGSAYTLSRIASKPVQGIARPHMRLADVYVVILEYFSYMPFVQGERDTDWRSVCNPGCRVAKVEGDIVEPWPCVLGPDPSGVLAARAFRGSDCAP